MEIGDWVAKENGQLRQGIHDFFCSLYREEFSWRPKLNDINFMVFDEANRLSLERESIEKESFEELMHCRRDKALGPNGFNMGFLKKF